MADATLAQSTAHRSEGKGRRTMKTLLVVSALVLLSALSVAQTPLALDENCTVSIGNQTVKVNPDGTFLVPNVSVFTSRDSGLAPQLFRVRATCLDDGSVVTGQSGFIMLTPGETVFIGDVFPTDLDPVPLTIKVTSGAQVLGEGGTVQLVVTATLPDGSTVDVTSPNDGTTYLSTNSSLLTVTQNGLVTGSNAGTIAQDGTILAINEGNLGTVIIQSVGDSDDLDGDGMPNDYEDLFGLNKFSNDAAGDLDNDGLTNLQEFMLGTLPNVDDTDGDGILDGVDGDPLHPEESPPMVTITSPADGATLVEGAVILFSANIMDDGLLTETELSTDTGLLLPFTQAPYQTSFTVPQGVGTMTFTARGKDSVPNETTVTHTVSVIVDPLTMVVGHVVDPDGALVAGADITTNGGATGTTDAFGMFAIPNVQTVFGDIVVTAETLVGGKLLKGKSESTPLLLGGITNVGTIELGLGELLAAFEINHTGGAQLSLSVSAETPTTVTVDIPFFGTMDQFQVMPGVVTAIPISNQVQLTGSDVVTTQGIAITSDADISVYGLSRITSTTDAFAVLPLSSGDTEYRVMSYAGSISAGSQFAVVAAEDNTTVTITPSANATNHAAGVPFQVMLNRLETYQLRAAGVDDDLTGTHVQADNPIALYAGHSCVNIPDGFGACDHIVEQLPSFAQWGKNLLTMNLSGRTGGDTFRIMAQSDLTDITITGGNPQTLELDEGEFVEMLLDGPNQILASKPILVCQYANGTNFDGKLGDPFMMVLFPEEQFRTSYTFTTPASGFGVNFANVIAKTEEASVDLVMIDGAAIPSASFVPIGTSGFSAAQVPITVGSHTLTSNKPLGVYVYGFNSSDSYGYPGGSRL